MNVDRRIVIVAHLVDAVSIRSLIALLLGRLRMSIDDAIKYYVKFAERVFSAKQIGRDGKFNEKTFEDAIKEIVAKVTKNPQERMLDKRSNACKV